MTDGEYRMALDGATLHGMFAKHQPHAARYAGTLKKDHRCAVANLLAASETTYLAADKDTS
jgi:hypothetical protein